MNFRASGDVSQDDKLAIKELTKRYFKGSNHPVKAQFVEAFGLIYTDALHSSSTHAFAQKVAEKSTSPVYQYIYTHAGSLCMAEIGHLSFWQVLAKVSLRMLSKVQSLTSSFQFLGRCLGLDFYPSSHQFASHSDDQLLIFNANYLPFDGAYTEQDRRVSQHLLRLWTNFVKNGHNPGSTWIPLGRQRLEIGSQGLKMVDLDTPLMHFWSSKIWPLLPPQIALNGNTVTQYLPAAQKASAKDEL